MLGQDAERGRQSSLTTLLAEVSERGKPKPSREEADRLKRDVRTLLPLCLLCSTPAPSWPMEYVHSSRYAPSGALASCHTVS